METADQSPTNQAVDTVRVGDRGGIVLSKAVRERARLKPGAELSVHVREDGVIELREGPSIAALAGAFAHLVRVRVSDAEMKRGVQRALAEKHAVASK